MLLPLFCYVSVSPFYLREFHSLLPELIFLSIARFCVSLIGFSNPPDVWRANQKDLNVMFAHHSVTVSLTHSEGIGFHVGSVGVCTRLLVG